MTNDIDPHDSIEPPNDHDRRFESSDDKPGPRSTEAPSDGSSSGVDRRGFLKRTAAFGAAAFAGLSLTTDDARAARKEIVVTATGDGPHHYEIHMKSISESIGSPSIELGPDANGNDEIKTVTSHGDRHEMVEGKVWGNRQGARLIRNEDNYFYSGEIDHIIADGNLKFDFPSGAFRTVDDDRIQINVWARESGKHSYDISTKSGDIDKIDQFTGSGDRDYYGPSSERPNTSDGVSGAVWNNNRDSYLLREGKVHSISTIGNMNIEVDDL